MASITTIQELEAALESGLRYIDRAKADAEKAAAKLGDGTGRSKYAPHVEQAQLQVIHEGLASAVADVLEDVTEWRALAGEYRRASKADPLTLLDGAELHRASLLMPLATATADSLPLSDLAERIEAIAETGDLPAKLVYRLAGERRAAAEKPAPGPGATVTPSGDSGRLEFMQAMDRLRAVAVHPKTAEAAALSDALLRAAASLEIAAGRANPVKRAAATATAAF